MIHRPLKREVCDVLVIGGGGSGVLAAVEASEQPNLRVLLACKGPVGKSGLTPTSNGGTAALGAREDLLKVMLQAGRYLNDQDLIWFMLEEITPALKRLNERGIGVIPLRGRSVCVIGKETLKRLRRLMVQRENIGLMEDVLVTSLLSAEGRISGAAALDLRTGEFFLIQAKAVVLATGGSTGEMYPHSSNNPFGVTTDASASGHIMAFQAGAELIDMEMIQFLPLPANQRSLHIRYFPEFWTGPYLNAAGDVVESDVNRYAGASYSYQLIRRLFREIDSGRGPIYIDKRATPAEDSRIYIRHWEVRRRQMRDLGIDPRENRIEITLGSHFSMGGVRVNARTETAVPGLSAAGEMMGGVHGALRVSGFSFTQMIVFGLVAGRQAAAFAASHPPGTISKEVGCEDREKMERFLAPKNTTVSVGALKRRLQSIMEKYAFVERDALGLKEGLRQMRAIRDEISQITVPSIRRFNLEWARAIEFPSLVQASELVLASALKREESRAFHYRTDFPNEDNERWLRHTVIRMQDGKPAVSTSPVELTRLRPEA